MTDLARRIADLTPEQQEQFRQRLAQKRAQESPAGRIEPQVRPPSGLCPVSYAQLRMWLLDQLHPDSAAYNLHAAVHLQGALNIAALRRSIAEIVRRHEALRTTFVMVEGQPMQRIAPALELPLPAIDLRDLPEARRQAAQVRLAAEEAVRPFNLAQGPLLRITLLCLSDVERLLLFTNHHMISDEWSVGVFVRELSVLYQAFDEQRPSPLPPLPIQYADFAIWQRQQLEAEGRLQAHLAYWKERLAGAPTRLELPADYARSAHPDIRGAYETWALPRPLCDSLKRLAQEERATLFMIFLAAFQWLLARHTGQEDIVVGAPLANRSHNETEGLIGFFLNPLVLRTRFDTGSADLTFRALLQQVRETCLDAYAHQDLPFEKLVEELQPERDWSRHPLFDVVLDFINTPGTALQLAGLRLSVRPAASTDSKLAMSWFVTEREGGLGLRVLYQQALLSPEHIRCLLAQFEYLLQQIAVEPDRPIRAYSLVTAEAAARLPDPAAALPEPAYEPVTHLIAAWAARAGEQPAIRQHGRAWTYQDFVGDATRLARCLIARGLNPGDRVAVQGPRSYGLIVSMAAVFWSGGVLLTLDPGLPARRRHLMQQEAQARWRLLVGPDGAADVDAALENTPAPQTLRVEAATARVLGSEGGPDLDPVELPALGPDDAAYLFFTSGTTGRPRGVLGCHKGLSHFLVWQRQTFEVSPADRCAQLTALSFDVVLRDIFTPLVSGAALCLPDDVDDLGPDQLMSWLEREQITLLHIVPTLAQAWLEALPAPRSSRTLKRVFFAGEPLTDTLVRRWRDAFTDSCQIVNLYGPTETTLAKCYYVVPTHGMSPGVQPVGWPLPETQALVLNAQGQLCGFGEPGQIVIRTPFRTLGYLNAGAEGEQRFVKNPFGAHEGDLLYYTGDRGRYRFDGALEILGRLDHQVKIRGVRVEPDEVAALLGQLPGVRACLVMAREDSRGHTSLAAYVVPADAPLDPAELKWQLSLQLPQALVPSAFVFLDDLPRTPNGKVDRAALPPPGPPDAGPQRPYTAPRSPLEEVLAGIWAELLGAAQVGIHDNFFELHGHSLLATQLIARLRDAFQIKIRLRGFYDRPTIAGLSALMLDDPAERERVEKTAETLLTLSQLSDEEVEAMLGE